MDPATDWVGSRFGYALQVTGGSEWVQTPWFPDPRVPQTIAMFANLSTVIEKYLFGTHDGVNRAYLGEQFIGVGDAFFSPFAFTENEWKVWFLLYDGSNAWAYENERLLRTFGYAASAASTLSMRIGARNHITSPLPVTGQISWTAAWDRILTTSERQHLARDPHTLLRPRGQYYPIGTGVATTPIIIPGILNTPWLQNIIPIGQFVESWKQKIEIVDIYALSWLNKVAKGDANAVEWLQNASNDGIEVVSWLSRLIKPEVFAISWLGAAVVELVVGGVLSIDWLEDLLRDQDNVLEWLGTLERPNITTLEWLENIIKGDGVAISWLQRLGNNYVKVVDWLQTAAKDDPMVISWFTQLAIVNPIVVSWLNRMVVSNEIVVSWLFGISKDAPGVVSWLQSIIKEDILNVSWEGVAQTFSTSKVFVIEITTKQSDGEWILNTRSKDWILTSRGNTWTLASKANIWTQPSR